MKPRLLIVTPSAYVLGGLATWLDYLDPGRRRLGWDVTIGLVEGPRWHRPERYVAEHPHEHWIPIPCRTGTPEGRCRALCRAIRRVQPDVVLSVNIPDLFPAVARIRANGRLPVRAVMSVHGIQGDLYDDIRAYREVLDGVVCTNKLACGLAEQLGRYPADRIHYASYGTALGEPRQSVRRDRLVIAHVGRYEQDQKRVLDIPPILAALDERNVPFEFWLAGSGPDEEMLRRELAPWLASGRVRFLGRLAPDALVEQVYCRADVFLLPSLWETGPIVIWEAMAHGMAVVCSRYIGSGKEGALRHEENSLLFPVGHTDEAASQIARLWHEPDLLVAITTGGRRLVADRYSLEASVGHWNTVLQRVLCSPPLPPTAVPVRATSSRLDRWLRPWAGELVRRLLGRTPPNGDAGSEWPHSYGATRIDDSEFWRIAMEHDFDDSALTDFGSAVGVAD